MLDYTKKEKYDRTALRVNPAKTCQPVGAMYAALGVHECMPHSHGSQGCCAFHRMFLTRHFKDPAMASTSSFTEGASVFGGGSNLKTAAKNIFDIYNPKIIAVHTTCLSETIGDDLNAFIQDIDIPEGKYMVHTNTPSYKGSHITGFSNMVASFISYLSVSSGNKNGKAVLMPGFVNPGDMRELKRLATALGVSYTMLPDTSGVLDSPMTGKFEMYPKGGTTVEEIIALGNSELTLAFGKFASEAGAETLKKKCGVPYNLLPIPIGISRTDEYIIALQAFSKTEVPYDIEEERGQLVDILIDIHPYTYNKKVAIFGDPDTVLGITEFVLEMGMIPKYVLTGTPGDAFVSAAEALFTKFGVDGCIAKAGGDLYELHQWIKEDGIDLIIGGTHGKHIARAEDIPFIRAGFPIIDRYIHSYMPLVGYKGGMRLAEMITNALMDRQDRDALEEDFEMVM
ncbi:nitrogenase molybdenum-iron protein subunit beta [Anaerocolumna cellulosilytica]|uniref:Nitrogenase molybdenum-iron protein subunit beta n=1 Tax=Anaerocolumna cellulosilytica TaxID=433286 RepID=A0A6S6R0F0_9FIRM|nr:nitrogenase component 1 [Anaerocolumna cellulosilytica]MBB5193997.1 nitrogenase molybdenum-iron protein beta chain [Anaerocolumna cellulosilytica]BCJ94789.1 nitrogenase molybdenum-iron protein subunit beta [Anaerocolumna cellulosilytica]